MTGRPAAPGSRFARRISVIGPSGSGKTFLARALADRLGLPHYELDTIRWDPAGRELSRPEFVELVEALASRDDWIIDGHYRDVRHLIWHRADMVVWLNYRLPVIALRLLGRFRKKRQAAGAPRSAVDALASGAPSPNSITWGRRLSRLVRTLRERREYRQLLRAPEYSALVITELRSTRATGRWLAGLRPADPAAPSSSGM